MKEKVAYETAAETLEWLAAELRRAVGGDRDAMATVGCFLHEWCGMILVGPSLPKAAGEELVDMSRIAFEEGQAEMRADAERTCQSERA